jgi:putative copper export protein/methionine-rich copper-binding protein CopC
MTALLRLVAAMLLAGAVASLVAAGPAGAHAVLATADPAPEATLAASPTHIRVVLTERASSLSRLSLVGPGGKRVELGPTRVTGRILEARVGTLGPGTYRVRWASFSDEDGHLNGSSYRFRIGPGGPADAAGEGGLSTWLSVASRLLLLGGALLWAGSAVLAVLTRPDPGERLRGLRLAFSRRLGPIGLAAAGAAMVGETANGAAAALSGFPIGNREFLVGSGTGRLLVARVVVLLAAAATARGAASRSPVRSPQLVLAAGYLTLLAFSGHARLAPGAPLSGPLLDVIHLLAGAAWLGGIVLLGLALHPGPGDDADVALLAGRFSPVALTAAATLAVTGVFATEAQVPTASDLSGTIYGRLLLAKLVLVAVLVAMSAHVGFRLRPALFRAGRGTPDAARLAARLTAGLRLEAPVAVGIIACVALMTSRASPQAVAASRRPDRGPAPPPGAVLGRQDVGGHDVALTIVPGNVGPNRVIVSVRGTPADRVRLEIERPDQAGTALWLPLAEGQSTTEVNFPAAGEWQARVSLPQGQAVFPLIVGDSSAVRDRVRALVVADLTGPARQRCRDEVLGQEVALKTASHAPVAIVADVIELPPAGVPGDPDVVLGACGAGEWARTRAEEARVPLVAGEDPTPGSWSWPLAPVPATEGRIVGRLALELPDARRAVVVVGPEARFAAAAGAFRETFGAGGGRVEGVWSSSAGSPAGVAADIAAQAVDLLVLFGTPESVVPVVSELHRRGWRPGRSVVGGTSLLGPEVLDAAPDWAQRGLVYMAGFYEQDVKLVSAYVRGLLESFPGERPSLRGFAGFLQGRLLLDALDSAGGAGAERLRRSLDETFDEGWQPGRISIAWQADRRVGASELALFQLTPTLNLFAMLGGAHGGHAVGGLLYDGGDFQRTTSFLRADGGRRPE